MRLHPARTEVGGIAQVVQDKRLGEFYTDPALGRRFGRRRRRDIMKRFAIETMEAEMFRCYLEAVS